jgi:hypothetical protein
MDELQTKVKLCRDRLTPCLFRIPSSSLSKELSVKATPRDGAYSSQMLRVTRELTPMMEDAVQIACRNLNFPREILDVYVRPKNENNAFSSRDGGRARLIFNSYLVEISDCDELAYVVGHELGHYLFPEANVRQLTPNLEGCMISRYSEFTMDRIGLIACRSVDKVVSAELKNLSGLSNKHLRMDATAIVAQWREASKAPDTTSLWLHATHPPTGMRAKALIQFYGSDAFRTAIGQTGGEPIGQVNSSLESELDRLLDNHANQLISDRLNKLSGWLCAFVASRGIKLRLSNLRQGLCTAPEEIIKRCLNIIIEETPQADRQRISNEKLLLSLQEACELAPAHTRLYLQSVAEISEEIKPLLQQLDGLSRQQGIVMVPSHA